MEDEVEVVALEAGGRRQDIVRVTRGLVEVRIDRDHEIELFQGLLDLPAVRRRKHRIPSSRDERTDLPFTGRQDLLGERRDGEFTAELRQATDTRTALVEGSALTEAGAEAEEVERRPREHRPAHAVEVPGQDVQQLDQPLTEGAELLRRHAHASVAHRPG